eukprot:TRINITY_DN932_c2_g3_i1.p1 TRINITY_DN932_c2_g3~~TRINITY_DN932_c2_g3_i1.p1  ORF type:complete len:279 (+),score=31.53 TRINITY_DN932_c2_g3_i1:48-884(+)
MSYPQRKMARWLLACWFMLPGACCFRLTGSAEDSPGNGSSVEGGVEGVALNVRYRNITEEILTFPERRPFAFHMMIAVTTKVGGDAAVQFYENYKTGSQGLDFRRCCLFLTFGFFYIGLAQWYLYVNVFSTVCPKSIRFANESLQKKISDPVGQRSYVCELLVDNCFHYVFLYLPAFYVLKEFIQGNSRCSLRAIMLGMKQCWKNLRADVLLAWMVWIPADLIVFAVPMWLRLPINHTVNLIWALLLSYVRGAEIAEEPCKAEDETVPKDIYPTSKIM